MANQISVKIFFQIFLKNISRKLKKWKEKRPRSKKKSSFLNDSRRNWIWLYILFSYLHLVKLVNVIIGSWPVSEVFDVNFLCSLIQFCQFSTGISDQFWKRKWWKFFLINSSTFVISSFSSESDSNLKNWKNLHSLFFSLFFKKIKIGFKFIVWIQSSFDLKFWIYGLWFYIESSGAPSENARSWEPVSSD